MQPVIMIMELLLWELIFNTATQGYNISYSPTSHQHVRHQRETSPQTLKIKYHYENEVELVVLNRVLDTTLEPNFLPIVSIEEDNGESARHELLGIDPVYYHGVNSFSAITLFPHKNTLHGVIDHRLYIDDLPLQNAEDPNLVDPFIYSISNDFLDATEHPSKCQPTQMGRKRKLDEKVDDISNKRFGVNPSDKFEKKILYPEILLAVDVSSRIDNTYEGIEQYDQVIMYVLTYWNAVDMLFRHLKRTNVNISIAGIFVGTVCRKMMNAMTKAIVKAVADETNYRVENARVFIQKEAALDSLGRYFYKQIKIKRDSFDFLMWMTRAALVDDHGLTRRHKDLGIAAPPADCGGLHVEELYSRKISNHAIFMHDDKYADYQLAARELAHLMFVSDDDVEILNGDHLSNCLPPNPQFHSSGIMDPENKRFEGHLIWSYCSELHFEKYANSISSCCLLNFPYRTMIKPKRPTQILTEARQCQCYGMQPRRQKYNRDICGGILKCKNQDGQYVKVARPLDGTPCTAKSVDHFCCENICV